MTFCDVRIHDRVTIAKARHSSLFLKSESAVSKNVCAVKPAYNIKSVYMYTPVSTQVLCQLITYPIAKVQCCDDHRSGFVALFLTHNPPAQPRFDVYGFRRAANKFPRQKRVSMFDLISLQERLSLTL